MEPDDASGYSITSCGNCVLCNNNKLCRKMEFNTNLSDMTFHLLFNASCKSSNFIYLLHCNHPGCEMKYVGKSTQTIRGRMYGHRSHLATGKEPHLLQWHFTKVHQPSNMIVKPIELITGSTDIDVRENYWMKEINTIFPYGLNDRTDDKEVFDAYKFVMKNRSCKPIYSLFNKVEVTRTTRGRGHGTRQIDGSPFNPDEFLCAIMEHDGSNHFKRTRTEIMALNKDHTKMLFLFSINHQDDPKYSRTFNEYFMYVVKDICLFKLQREYTPKKRNNNYLVVRFDNKMIENVNISRILSSPNVTKFFPHQSVDMSTPNVTYSYTSTIRSHIVNYKQTVEEIGNTTFICRCENYPEQFINNTYGHIYTGDLDIISNPVLKNLLQNGLNYRDQQPPCKVSALKSITSAIDKYIGSISGKINKSVRMFSTWRAEILKTVKSKLDSMEPYRYYSCLKDVEVKAELSKLQEDFVFTPVDKAANNVSIVCKKLYVEKLETEIENSGNFIKCNNVTVEDVMNSHKQAYQDIGIQVSDNIWKLPFVYGTSKMHKTPPKFRYITSGVKSSMSVLSKHVGKCLKSLLKSAKNISRYENKYTGYNDYFIIDDRKDVIELMEWMNANRKKGGRKKVSTYDFSNLYTSIPHDKLKLKMKEFVNDVFLKKDKRFVISSYCNAFLSKNRSNRSTDVSFSKDDLIKAIEIIIDNSFITYKNCIYRQIIGIPMGTSCAPHLANIFLFMYESQYIKKLIRSGQTKKAALLGNIFRYQDDAIVFNDNGVFGEICRDIYPEELVLLNTNINRTNVHYLDLNISLQSGIFKYSLFDKRNDFNFNVISYPFLSGNIPKIPSYGVYIAQLIRFCNVSSESIQKVVMDLNSKLSKQGFIVDTLKRKFQQFASKYIHLWSKFGEDIVSENYLNSIFPPRML